MTELQTAPLSADDPTPYAEPGAEPSAAPVVSLKAQVRDLERQHEERAAQVTAAEEAVAEKEAAFLAGTGTPEALATAQAALSAHQSALDAITARLAPLQAQWQAEQAEQRQAAERAAQRAELEAAADECAAYLAALHAARAELVRTFDAGVVACGQAKIAAQRAQARFFELLVTYTGGGSGPEAFDAQRRAIAQLRRGGADVDAVATNLHGPYAGSIYSRPLGHAMLALTFPPAGPLSGIVDGVIGQLAAADSSQV